jgi:hypothetical protein
MEFAQNGLSIDQKIIKNPSVKTAKRRIRKNDQLNLLFRVPLLAIYLDYRVPTIK